MIVGLLLGWLVVLAYLFTLFVIFRRGFITHLWRHRCRERWFDWTAGTIYLCRLTPGHTDRHYAREKSHGRITEVQWREGTHEWVRP